MHEEKTDELKYENDFVKQELHDVPDRFEDQDGDIDLRGVFNVLVRLGLSVSV